MSVRRSFLAALGATSLALLAACGDDDSSTVVTDDAVDDGGPGLTGPAASDLVVSCGPVEFGDIPADTSSLPALGERTSEIDLASIEGERELFEVHDWSIASESDDELELFGTAHDAPPDGPNHAYATLERADSGWVPRSWGQCGLEVDAPGWGHARFVLDPGTEPDAASSTVSLRAWEVDCANGQAPDDRAVEPVILDDDDTVSVVILVEPVQEGAECPGNPSFSVELELDEPLGERAVYDASVDPAQERSWPPSESSLESQGRR
ncbi:hypothetical protein EF847_18280 [Actinobacteria bacterium YIM 96077]|uniref:LppP/LprE family lipoprotein n=1 Tax=Phytoactinopolyspora halophila TaxID=1981511 RepID=A0A329QHS8_9ACTN|nr:hypothetical protein [Phytoactinopolyspora halophila]AYY14351.1 hypothetical protein EF847_18280 [Actinobacteria bacterium YIM 96077]RAW11925.1 hypothetical protein DPM12_15840 [Phytoactinopolyspora halophila]